MSKLTKAERAAIVDAYCDLKGALEARDMGDSEKHDWDGHHRSIRELQVAFPFVEPTMIRKPRRRKNVQRM